MPARQFNQIIPPFPEHIDRRDFANYLSGLVDGEASFQLTIGKGSGYFSGAASFRLKMRADDCEIIQLAQSFLGCGTIYFVKPPVRREPDRRKNDKPVLEYNVHAIADICTIIIPHFNQFPLRAKKANDFTIWSQGAMLLQEIKSRILPTLSTKGVKRTEQKGFGSRWTDADRLRFTEIHAALRAQREYQEPIGMPYKQYLLRK